MRRDGSDQPDGPVGHGYPHSPGVQSLFAVSLVLAMVSVLGFSAQEVAAAENHKPNVVLIMADDLGYEALGAYGCKAYRTPRLDAVAREGMIFKYCFATPLCTPTRVMLMTGKYGHRNYRKFGHFPKEDEKKTIGNLMKKAGYATCMAGKWHVKGVTAKAMGFDRSLRCECWSGYWGTDGGIWVDDRKVKPKEIVVISSSEAPVYRPDVSCNFVLKFIRENKDRPFFVYYPMFLPHHPEQPTPDSNGKAEFLKSGKPDAIVPGTFPDMVAYMDKLVGRVVDTLQELGLREKTIILFTGDNGTCVHKVELNGHLVGGGKGSMKDNGTRVPLVVSWKGTTLPGKVSDDLIDFSDFYPTLAEAAGVPVDPGRGIDGVSFYPQIAGRKATPREWAFMHYRGRSAATDGGNWPTKPGSYWVRDRRWKLYHDGKLFDLDGDPDEKNPLGPASAAPEAEAVRLRLQAVFKRLAVTPDSLIPVSK